MEDVSLAGSHAIADKVRVKSGDRKGERGTITAIVRRGIAVKLANGAIVIQEPDELTNFSLAARKAWKSMPRRRVGRPRGSSLSDRVSVTVRIDRDLWDEFKHAESIGAISHRTQTLNEWIRQGVQSILSEGKKAS